MQTLPLLILLLPLVGFLINGLLLPKLKGGMHHTHGPVPGVIATAFIALAAVLSGIAFLQISSSPETVLRFSGHEWLRLGTLKISFDLELNRLSALLAMIITGVGSLIHLYSIGYMSHEHGVARYFAYLNLFCFSMLLLVLGASLPLLFFGWEGVGLCSYLLIGYWFEDPAKASAGKKAFIVNRIGDLGFLLAMFLCFQVFGTLDFNELKNAVALHPVAPGLITAITLLLFLGATGKSAQIPLYVWLPDAMAGPTPVSALIHAATMVTAGVFMAARLHFLFDLSPLTLTVIAHTGALTALFAASIALVQNDIKKILAYSTVSQLGFMFLAIGVGSYTTAVFHLMTHAFFKALLFLGSGSVIHACQGEQDIRQMGGLKRALPITFLTMGLGTLAICGIPLFSGFFSKDEILFATLALPGGSTHLYFLGALAALFTSVYMTRMMILTFFGNFRGKKQVGDHLHESPWSMTVPLIVLATLATLGGFLGIPHITESWGFHLPHWLNHWLAPVVPAKEIPLQALWLPVSEGTAMVISVCVALVGIGFAWTRFRTTSASTETPSGLRGLLFHKYYIDELYALLIVRPLASSAQFLWRIVDVSIIDRFVLLMGKTAGGAGQYVRKIQTGDLQSAALSLGLGLLCFLCFFGWMILRS